VASGLDKTTDNPHAFYQTQKDAFWGGVKDAIGAPAIVLFAGMIGFGAMGRTNGLDVWFTGICSTFMFALPGQIILLDMLISHSSLANIALAVTLTSTRFVTMTLTLFPQFSKSEKNANSFAAVHLLAMTAWAVSMREFPKIAPTYRRSYFIGLGVFCWSLALPGTVLGYLLAGMVSKTITIGLIFINPLFFVLTFTEIKHNWSKLAVLLGCILGPVFYYLDPDTSLLLTGLIGGTSAYWIERKFYRERENDPAR
jgi:predicted branched-subunit amino acid permease